MTSEEKKGLDQKVFPVLLQVPNFFSRVFLCLMIRPGLRSRPEFRSRPGLWSRPGLQSRPRLPDAFIPTVLILTAADYVPVAFQHKLGRNTKLCD